MKIVRLLVATAALCVALGTSVQAQTTLRIGIAEDPDVLDPSPRSSSRWRRKRAST